MFQGRKALIIFSYFLLLIPVVSAAGDILSNGTRLYLSTGEPHELDQGYVIIAKSVGGAGSVWLQLNAKDKIVKSDIAVINGSFIYNKSNRTIISIKVDNIYWGSDEENLVSLSVYQFLDRDLPAPVLTGIIPVETPELNNNSFHKKPPRETLIWVMGIGSVLILFYLIRKLW